MEKNKTLSWGGGDRKKRPEIDVNLSPQETTRREEDISEDLMKGAEINEVGKCKSTDRFIAP